MGRFHRHDDDPAHAHEHAHGHEHEHGHGHGQDGGQEGAAGRAGAAPGGLAVRDHGDHSGYQTGAERIDVLERIFGENDQTAAANRADFDASQVTVVNLMSSPGAGKTSLLQETLRRLHGRIRFGIIEGDIETSIDADRLAGFGAAISLLNTGDGFGGECHLDAPMVRSALARIPLDDIDLLVIENVGNLVCPAEFTVGEHARAMVYSITEGEEKPLKYPVMFRSADVVVVNKVDLLPYLDFDLPAFHRNLRDVNPSARVIETSVRTGQGIDDWCTWLLDPLPHA